MRSFQRGLFGCFLPFLLFALWVSTPVRSSIPLQPGYWLQVGEVAEWGNEFPQWLKPYLSLQVEGDAQSVFSNAAEGIIAIGEENPLPGRSWRRQQ